MIEVKPGEKLEVIPPSENLQKIIDMNAEIVRINAAIVKVLCSYSVFVTTPDGDGDRQ